MYRITYHFYFDIHIISFRPVCIVAPFRLCYCLLKFFFPTLRSALAIDILLCFVFRLNGINVCIYMSSSKILAPHHLNDTQDICWSKYLMADEMDVYNGKAKCRRRRALSLAHTHSGKTVPKRRMNKCKRR